MACDLLHKCFLNIHSDKGLRPTIHAINGGGLGVGQRVIAIGQGLVATLQTENLIVGANLLFNEIPDDENLVFIFNKMELAQIIASVGLPFVECTGALVKSCGGYYEKIWLSQARRAFDLDARYVLVKHLGQSIHVSDLKF